MTVKYSALLPQTGVFLVTGMGVKAGGGSFLTQCRVSLTLLWLSAMGQER